MLRFTPLYRLKGVNYPFGFELQVVAGGPSSMVLNAMSIEAIVWCHAQFGSADYLDGKKPEEFRWRADFRTIDFASEVDATAFRLRWS
ncbi:MAG: hypothetical protein EOP83_01375 [Verrucomicrobiaceae bacterium]|nr:MAG: hypothetical protein EOP83_01375 [Verrucomicrobiaceae bacterium]